MAGVKFDAHYNVTGIDPPDLVWFIKKNYPDVIFDKPRVTIWELIVKHGCPPIRQQRYCCKELKERGGTNRICVTGVRWEESPRRRLKHDVLIKNFNSKESILLNDNTDKRILHEYCSLKSKHILNPIIDWTNADVWNFIRSNDLEYCKLYDEGWRRIGCIACPMAVKKERSKELERYPKFKALYLRAIKKMLKVRIEKGRSFKPEGTAEDVLEWWITGKIECKGQLRI